MGSHIVIAESELDRLNSGVAALAAELAAAVEDAHMSRAAAGAEAIRVNELTAENAGLVAENDALATQRDALLAACKAWQSYMRDLDVGMEPDDPLLLMRQRFHAVRILQTDTAIALCAAKEQPNG